MSRPFDAGDRTYYISDERLKAFKALTPEQRLKWVEELAYFVRLARAEKKNAALILERRFIGGDGGT